MNRKEGLIYGILFCYFQILFIVGFHIDVLHLCIIALIGMGGIILIWLMDWIEKHHPERLGEKRHE